MDTAEEITAKLLSKGHVTPLNKGHLGNIESVRGPNFIVY